MSRIGKAARAVARGIVGPLQERDGSLESMLGGDARRAGGGAAAVLPTQDTALRNSVWWGCINLRANVASNFPMDVFRPAGPGGSLGIPVKAPPIFAEPWPGVDISEWLYGTEVDKCRYGNSVGIIRGRNTFGKVTQVQPVPMSNQVRAVVRTDRAGLQEIVKWRIGQEEYNPEDIWHEKRYTLKGFPLGLSPLAYAAYSMGVYASAQQFALDWFALGPMPRGVLKNTELESVPAELREAAKAQFKASTLNGDIFVTGSEWEWTPSATDAATPDFLAQQESSSRDVCRYLGVPASMVDVEVTTGNITYANITQANLQWLITEVGPEARRTERYWSRMATPAPWYVKMNTDALLRMDPQTRNTVLMAQLQQKARTPDEVRALDNLPPYTPDQLEQLALFAGMGKSAPTPPADPNEDPAAQAEDGKEQPA